MGNMQAGGSGDEGEDQPQRQEWPSLSVSWKDFQERRRSPYNEEDPEMDLNGLIFGEHIIPDDLLECILSLVCPEDILNCNLVCKNWKDIIVRRSYWKKWFVRYNWNWNMVPQHIKEKPNSWIVFHAQVRHHILTKNFINNHSGVGDSGTRFENWEIFRNGGDGWLLENPPSGCDPLPPDPFFDNSTSTWTTSFQMCSKWTSVDLWKLGLTPPVMITCLPFSLACSQKYTARWDCGGVLSWILRILDRQDSVIDEFTFNRVLDAQTGWETATHSFKFKESSIENISELKSLAFIHEGRDSQFWKGHYGIKLARSCVKFQFDGLQVEEST